MNAEPGRWRRLAVKLARHAACVMPGARSPWADAMRRELDYIGDDAAALRWALGCILASYRTRLAHRASFSARGFSARAAWHVAASGVVMLVIGLSLQDNAEGQTAPPRPAFDETSCDQSQGEAIQSLRSQGLRSQGLRSQDLRSQDLRSQDRARFHRPISADARPIECRSDCADPLPPDIPDTCKTEDTLRGR